MCNSPIDNLMINLDKAQKEAYYLRNELKKYKMLGHIEVKELKNLHDQIIVRACDNVVYVEFANKQFILNQSDLLMLSNLNGLFNNIPGGSGNEFKE